jgi:hypothetical protein
VLGKNESSPFFRILYTVFSNTLYKKYPERSKQRTVCNEKSVSKSREKEAAVKKI